VGLVAPENTRVIEDEHGGHFHRLEEARDRIQVTKLVTAAGEQIRPPGEIDEGLGLEHLGENHRDDRGRSHRRGREAKRFLVLIDRPTDVVARVESRSTIAPSTGAEVVVDEATTATHAALRAVQGGQGPGAEKGLRSDHVSLLLFVFTHQIT
jgi:hypothetical protein